jgi:hypothetical protein
MINPELKKAISDYITKCDESHLEYETEHSDAGDAYIHCVMEDKRNWGTTFEEYVKQEFPELDEQAIEWLLGEFDEWDFEMKPGHRFTSFEPAEGCCIWFAAIEEVENQIEVSRIAEEFDCSKAEVCEIIRWLKNEGHHCIRCDYIEREHGTFETYQATDCCWFAVISREWFADKIEEYYDEQE